MADPRVHVQDKGSLWAWIRREWWCSDCWEHLSDHQNVSKWLAFRASIACARNPGVRAARKELS